MKTDEEIIAIIDGTIEALRDHYHQTYRRCCAKLATQILEQVKEMLQERNAELDANAAGAQR
jgi:hypothetical protein